MKCCICGKEIPKDQGNNPWPVKDEGECCFECNLKHVIPARIEMATPKETITALLVEPGRQPRAIEIANDLKTFQDTVGGYIEAVSPFEDPVCLVVNEEGKILGLRKNRPIVINRRTVDVICGTFLVVGDGGEEFISLTPEQVRKYTDHFTLPMVVVSR